MFLKKHFPFRFDLKHVPKARRTRAWCQWRPFAAGANVHLENGDITGVVAAFDVSGPHSIRNSSEKDMPIKPGTFGTEFTENMLSVHWTAENGWEVPRIHPLEDLRLHPATSSLHYAFQCFEGTKVYRDAAGGLRLFRPDMNMRRLNVSAERLSLPTFDAEHAVQLLARFAAHEQVFVPSRKGESLYLRPTLISTEPAFAMVTPRSALLYIIASPVGNFYATGTRAITLEATTGYTRAWPGGIGYLKAGANYAACFVPQIEAAAKGYQQNLWLVGEEEYLSEVGTMNLFVLITHAASGKQELVTPPLDGTILPGVTRDSVLSLARTRLPGDSYFVSERPITIAELAQASDEGRLREVFGTGTAVVISPVKRIGWKDRSISCGLTGGQESGLVARLMKEWIERIQYGEVKHEWSFLIE